MVIYDGSGRIYETEMTGILTYTDDTDRVSLVVGQEYINPRHIFKGIDGVHALRSGDLELAAKYELRPKDLLRMKWAARYQTTLHADMPDPARSLKEIEAGVHDREVAYMKKHGTYHFYEDEVRRKNDAERERVARERNRLRYVALIKPIHAAGYTTNLYLDSASEPEYRLINLETGDWDDDGPYCGKRNGVFSLSELESLFLA